MKLTSPKKLLNIINFSKSIRYQWDLIRCLVDRNIKILYKRSTLGILWMLIKPLLTLAVYAFVFRTIVPVNVPFFTSFLFTGLLFWSWFSSSLGQGTGVIVNNASLIRQPGFPNPILPIVVVITEWIHLSMAIPVLFLFFLWESIVLKPVVFLLPVLMLLQFALTLSLSYILAGINVSFRDTQHTINVLLQMLMYLSGIFYNINVLPVKYQTLLYLNPMANLLNCYRSILIYGKFPPWQGLIYITLLIIFLFPLGLWIFKKQSDRFVEEL
jgi:lipopolysaccharide transport system permease protein